MVAVPVLATGRPDRVAVGRGLLALAVLALPWSAVQVGGVPLGDFPLALAVVALLLHRPSPVIALPGTLVVGALVVGLAGVLTHYGEPSSAYVAGRYQPDNSFAISINATVRSVSNLLSLFKFELALLLVPFAIVLATRSVAVAQRIAVAWVLGIVVCAAVAMTDFVGITHISPSLIGYSALDNRQAGLTPQANSLGEECAMAIPVVTLGFLHRRPVVRLATVVGELLLVGGVVVSGSRGNFVGIVVALVLMLALVPATRNWFPQLTLLGLTGLVVLAASGAGAKLLAAVRLTSGSDVAGSDTDRDSLRAQGIADFLHSPLHGIGWGYANDAHLIYIQVLAAGGLIGMAGFLIYTLGIVGSARVLVRRHQLAGAALATVLTWMITGFVENILADQWVYVPTGILAGLLVLHRHPGTDEPGLAVVGRGVVVGDVGVVAGPEPQVLG